MEKTKDLRSAYHELDREFDAIWNEHGREHFHPDVGEFWLPPHVRVSGDLEDTDNLALLSRVMDKYNLEVLEKHGVSFCERDEDGSAILV